MKQLKPIVIFHFCMVYIVMGSTYFFIKLAIQTIPPLLVLSFRFFVGGLLVILYARIKDGKIKIPTKSELFNALIMGFFLFVSGVGLVTFGQQFTFSYITSLIVASVPLLVAFFDYILYKKRITKTSLIGISGKTVVLVLNQSALPALRDSSEPPLSMPLNTPSLQSPLSTKGIS